jgi:hypothetical protein
MDPGCFRHGSNIFNMDPVLSTCLEECACPMKQFSTGHLPLPKNCLSRKQVKQTSCIFRILRIRLLSKLHTIGQRFPVQREISFHCSSCPWFGCWRHKSLSRKHDGYCISLGCSCPWFGFWLHPP